MFQTDASWQDIDLSQLMAGMFGDPGLRCYRCFEVAVNCTLFHVDVLLREETDIDCVWSRFIFYDLRNVLQFITDERIKYVRINIQTSMKVSRQYDISSVVEIVEGCDRQGQIFHVCLCVNNDRHTFPNTVLNSEDGGQMKLIWKSD